MEIHPKDSNSTPGLTIELEWSGPGRAASNNVYDVKTLLLKPLVLMKLSVRVAKNLPRMMNSKISSVGDGKRVFGKYERVKVKTILVASVAGFAKCL